MLTLCNVLILLHSLSVYQIWSKESCWLASVETVISFVDVLTGCSHFTMYLPYVTLIQCTKVWSTERCWLTSAETVISHCRCHFRLFTLNVNTQYQSLPIYLSLEYWEVLISTCGDSNKLLLMSSQVAHTLQCATLCHSHTVSKHGVLRATD